MLPQAAEVLAGGVHRLAVLDETTGRVTKIITQSALLAFLVKVERGP